jgi:hypothetical protein
MDENIVVNTAGKSHTAVKIIKTAQRRPWGDHKQWAATWYEPYKDQKSIDMAIHWALSYPGIFVNTVGDIHVLPMVLDAANRYETPPTDAQMLEMTRTQGSIPLWI